MFKIPLDKEKFALVDYEDYLNLSKYKWSSKSGGLRGRTEYAVTYLSREGGKQRRIFMHRFLMNTPVGMDTDHINGNGLDNRKSNLRICTHAQNLKNKRLYSRNISGVAGVTWHSGQKKWWARVKMDCKEYYLGVFDKKEEAKERVLAFRESMI